MTPICVRGICTPSCNVNRNYCDPFIAHVTKCDPNPNYIDLWYTVGGSDIGRCPDINKKDRSVCDTNTSIDRGSYSVNCPPGDNSNMCHLTDWFNENKQRCFLGLYDDIHHCSSDWCSGAVPACADILTDYCGNYPENAGLQPICITFCQNSDYRGFPKML